MSATLLKEGHSFSILVSVENRHSAGERYLADPFVEDFSLEFHGSHHAVALNPQFYIGVLNGIRKWRRLRRPGWLRSPFHELVVFVQREGDVAGIGQGQRGFILCPAQRHQTHTSNQD